jgi:hypothetical protein
MTALLSSKQFVEAVGASSKCSLLARFGLLLLLLALLAVTEVLYLH